MTELSGSPGFAAPLAGKKLSRRRAVALELVATVTLTISLVVAATAVSLGNRSLVERPLAAAPTAPRSITRKAGSEFCGHSGSRANGPARSGRPDDRLREAVRNP